MSELLSELQLDGIVAAIGAGGKKSVLNELAAGAPGRVAWTGTVFTARPPRWTGVEVHVGEETELLDRAAGLDRPGRHAFLLPSDKPGRYGGMSPEGVDQLHQVGRFDLTLVKADGARMRGLKCPRPGEPVLPDTTGTVLLILSARVIGQPLTEEFVHRPERVAAVTGRPIGQALTPADLAAVFTRPGGISEGTAGRTVIPIINQVDDDVLRAHASETARQVLAASQRFDRVILTCLHRTSARRAGVVDVIRRSS
ncbi:MAG: selenium cofactor biosynthesis protein YqeC [Wenzhouxiangella sp.]